MFNALVIAFSTSFFLGVAKAHVSAYAKGMYCSLGNTGSPDLNSYAIVKPLYDLPFADWWMHHVDNCDAFPPPEGEFLELPAGGSFTVEIASNRAKTTLSYGGRDTSDWPDGATYPADYHIDSCILSPNLHTQNEQNAAGTVFAIAYKSELSAVTPEDLTVFTVADKTPFRRLATYEVPAAMPACPPAGCICAWGWVPNGCGQPNMYMAPFKCMVTSATSTTPIAPPKPPVWCENNPDACVKGAKQMVYWHQRERNNVFVDGLDAAGQPKSPGYNMKMGFRHGAQNDIFGGPPSGGNTAAPAPAPAPAPQPAPADPAQAPPAQQNPPPQNNASNGNAGNTGGNSDSGSGSSTGGSQSPPAGSGTPASDSPTPSAQANPSGNTGSPPASNPASDTASASAPAPTKSSGKKCKPRPTKRGLEARTKRSFVSRLNSHHRRQTNNIF